MNYSDFAEIIEDEFTGESFGKTRNLTVLGWVEKRRESQGKHKKIYLVKCTVCENDPELFGDGLFKTTKTNLVKGQIPCGCSKKPAWSTEQWAIRLSRKLDSDHRFVRLISPEKGAFSKVEVFCERHGPWLTASANNIMNGQGCRLCANEGRVKNLSKHNSFSDNTFIENFYELGRHSRDITFTRIDSYFWAYNCNVCGEYCETRATHLYRGVKSCSCAKFSPKQAYINFVLDGNFPIALKFGVSSSAIDRKYRHSIYNFHLYSVWEFESRRSCMLAEAECKNSFISGIIPKNEMPECYSETTYIHNLDKILETYKSFGGKEIMRDLSNVFSS